MTIVTVDEVKTHLRIQHDEEDAYIEGLIKQAQTAAEDYCRTTFQNAIITNEDGEELEIPVPEPVRLAVILMTTYKATRMAFDSLLYPYRDPEMWRIRFGKPCTATALPCWRNPTRGTTSLPMIPLPGSTQCSGHGSGGRRNPMAIELRGFDDLKDDMINMAYALDQGPDMNRALKAGTVPIESQMLHNASTDTKIITDALHSSIHTGKVKQRHGGGKQITIGVHHAENGAYYANPVEFGHGGPALAPAHPFVRPAFDTRAEEAYGEIKRILRDELNKRSDWRNTTMANPAASPAGGRAIEASITPENADPDVQYADDIDTPPTTS